MQPSNTNINRFRKFTHTHHYLNDSNNVYWHSSKMCKLVTVNNTKYEIPGVPTLQVLIKWVTRHLLVEQVAEFIYFCIFLLPTTGEESKFCKNAQIGASSNQIGGPRFPFRRWRWHVWRMEARFMCTFCLTAIIIRLFSLLIKWMTWDFNFQLF